MFEKLVLVTRRTRLDGLIERFNTKGQAKFYLQQAGLDFADYEREHDTYSRSLEQTRVQVERSGLKVQLLDRAVVPTYLFAKTDLVVALGQDGLVANTAKYIGAQPLIGVNPDPERFDGVLLPFRVDEVRQTIDATVKERALINEVTLAEVKLSDGQKLLAFNDLYIGARTHVSSQYRLKVGKSGWVRHSSSGVIVSTGAGSTGWLSSVFAMARALGGTVTPVNIERGDRKLYFVVREPFASKQSTVAESFGVVNAERVLQLESLMPSGGVIFSDGMEDDALMFTSGLMATIGPADQRARLVARAR